MIDNNHLRDTTLVSFGTLPVLSIISRNKKIEGTTKAFVSQVSTGVLMHVLMLRDSQ